MGCASSKPPSAPRNNPPQTANPSASAMPTVPAQVRDQVIMLLDMMSKDEGENWRAGVDISQMCNDNPGICSICYDNGGLEIYRNVMRRSVEHCPMVGAVCIRNLLLDRSLRVKVATTPGLIEDLLKVCKSGVPEARVHASYAFINMSKEVEKDVFPTLYENNFHKVFLSFLADVTSIQATEDANMLLFLEVCGSIMIDFVGKIRQYKEVEGGIVLSDATLRKQLFTYALNVTGAYNIAAFNLMLNAAMVDRWGSTDYSEECNKMGLSSKTLGLLQMPAPCPDRALYLLSYMVLNPGCAADFKSKGAIEVLNNFAEEHKNNPTPVTGTNETIVKRIADIVDSIEDLSSGN